MTSILVTGAHGQIGSELVEVLRTQENVDQVVGLDLNPPSATDGRASSGPFVCADVRNHGVLADTLDEYDVDVVYHLASLLSATGEKKPDRAWNVNMTGLRNLLDLARKRSLKLFWPSSIAVFGPSTPKTDTPQQTVLDPSTMYGVTKRSGELLCQYHHRRYGTDVRSLRYPGLVSHKTPPGGGTTDYTVDLLAAAARRENYTCFLERDTRLPMMYMPDALQATLDLMAAPPDALSVRDSYNIGALSFSPEELVDAVRRHVPDFSCQYDPDERQKIADAWPSSIDDERARADWGWEPGAGLEDMVEDMINHMKPEGAPECS
jgi:nucleoside-diphosphate-sugar epimerase